MNPVRDRDRFIETYNKMENQDIKKEIVSVAKKQSRPVSNGMNKKIIASSLAFVVILLPVVAVAQGLIPCKGAKDCNFDSFIMLINNVIKFLIFSVAVPLAAIGFVFVGAKLILNQDKEGAWSGAKESFWNIGIGFLIMLGSFVLIKFILYQFLNTEQGFTLFLIQ